MSTNGSLVHGVDFVFLPISDFEASRSFYVGLLGMEETKDYGNDGFGGEFETDGFTIQVVDAKRIGREVKSGGAIAFYVDDVEAARAELEGKGVEFFAETIDSGVCHQAFFSDPDGHALILHNRYAAPGERPEGL